MPINTLRKHMEAAVNEGWLDIDRGDKRKHIYRCAVPIHVKLSDRDVELREKILNTFGEIANREPSPICITPGMTQIQPATGKLYQPKDDTDATAASVHDEKPSMNGATNGAATPICINADPNLCQTVGQSVSEKTQSVSNSESSVSPKPPNPLIGLETQKEVLEVLRSSKEKFQREGAALPRSTSFVESLNGKHKEPEASNGREPERIRKVIKHYLAEGYTDQQIVIVAKVSIEEVQRMRRQQPT